MSILFLAKDLWTIYLSISLSHDKIDIVLETIYILVHIYVYEFVVLRYLLLYQMTI